MYCMLVDVGLFSVEFTGLPSFSELRAYVGETWLLFTATSCPFIIQAHTFQ